MCELLALSSGFGMSCASAGCVFLWNAHFVRKICKFGDPVVYNHKHLRTPAVVGLATGKNFLKSEERLRFMSPMDVLKKREI